MQLDMNKKAEVNRGKMRRVLQRQGTRTLVGGERYPSGRRKPPEKKGHDAAGTIWQRVQGHLDDMVAIGLHPDCGTVVGRLYLFGKITAVQAGAALRYAEVAGRYDHYHSVSRRSTASPAYERGWSYDHEVQGHENAGTVKQYEKRGRWAKNQWERIQRHIPNEVACNVIEEVSLHNREVPSALLPDMARVLDRIAKEFGFHPRKQS